MVNTRPMGMASRKCFQRVGSVNSQCFIVKKNNKRSPDIGASLISKDYGVGLLGPIEAVVMQQVVKFDERLLATVSEL